MSFMLRRIINVISSDMKMMALQPGLRGGEEAWRKFIRAVPPEEQGWMHSCQPLKPHLPSAIKGKKIEHDSREKKNKIK